MHNLNFIALTVRQHYPWLLFLVKIRTWWLRFWLSFGLSSELPTNSSLLFYEMFDFDLKWQIKLSQTFSSQIDRDFWAWTLVPRINWEIFISIEISQLSNLDIWKCQDFLDCQDLFFETVKIKSLDRDYIKTNRDPQAFQKEFLTKKSFDQNSDFDQIS